MTYPTDQRAEQRSISKRRALRQQGAVEPERKIVVVRCVCGRLKQQGFICDFCYSTSDQGSTVDS